MLKDPRARDAPRQPGLAANDGFLLPRWRQAVPLKPLQRPPAASTDQESRRQPPMLVLVGPLAPAPVPQAQD